MRPLEILTWHTHGSYLYYLSQVPHRFHVLVKPGRPAGYGGRCGPFPWGDNVREVAADAVARGRYDVVLYQDDHQYESDRFKLLSPAQRRLPAIYLEHDPPRAHPTDTRHPVDDPAVLLVHVTPFNALMWDSGRTPTCVIEHGVPEVPDLAYRGQRARGVVVVNHIAARGRRLGADLFERARREVALDLLGMGAADAGGGEEVPHAQLAARLVDYRFFFHPARYTSMGLAVIEAMLLGLPVLGLATTELATVITPWRNGVVDTDPARLLAAMHTLLREPELARALGTAGRRTARERFGLARFVADWQRAFARVSGGAAC